MELQTCSLFWVVSSYQSCASNACQGRVWFAHMETHYCIQWLPILFSSSERRGLCYPGPKITDTVALESLRNTEGDFLPNLRSRSLSDHLRPDSCLSWSGSFKKIDGSSLVFTVPERDSEISWSAHSWAVHARKKDKEKV